MKISIYTFYSNLISPNFPPTIAKDEIIFDHNDILLAHLSGIE